MNLEVLRYYSNFHQVYYQNLINSKIVFMIQKLVITINLIWIDFVLFQEEPEEILILERREAHHH